MESPQSGRSSVLPSQDPSPCSLTTAFDLSRKGEESLLKTSSMDSLHVVKAPSWYSINCGTNKGPPFTEKDSNLSPLPIEQIQSDDAFSNTTVTLSYVNRSHVFSSHDSLSQLHSLCGVSSVSGKRPHRPSSFERDPFLTDASRGGLCVEFGQGFLTHGVKPVGLTPDSAVCETQEPPPLIETVTGTHVEQPAVEMNGKQAGGPWVTDSVDLSHGDRSEKCTSSQEEEKDGSAQNGMDSGPWILVSHEEESPESPSVATEGVPKKDDSEVLLLISGTDDPGLLQDNRGPRPFLYSSFNGDYVSPLEDPLSPSSPSVDDMEDVFTLPQTLNSPSGDHSLADEAASATEENQVEREPGPDPSLTESTLTSVQGSLSQPGSHSDEVMEIPTGSNVLPVPSAVQEPCVEPPAMSNGESVCKETVSHTLRKLRTPDLLNGKTQESGRMIEKRTLPPRSRRGVRLGAIVQNIAPSRYNAHSAKKHCSPKTQAHQAHSVRADQGIFNSLCSQNHKEKTESPEEQFTVNTGSSPEDTGNIYQDHCNSKSTSGSDHANMSKLQHCSSSSKPSKPPDSKGQHCGSPAKRSPRRAGRTALSVSEVCQKSPTKQLRASASSKPAHAAKKSKPKRKRKKRCAGQPSMFSPKEPEIKLKYVNYREEKRDRCDAFSPFVRVEMKKCASCTIINYPEEEPRLKKGRPLACSSFASGAVPSTSCLQLGRLDTESKRRSTLVCCLCRKSANFPDLGDLHGPYHPDCFRLDPKARLGPKEEDSDSDSLCSLQGGKRAHAAGSWPQRPRERLQQKGMLGASRRWGSDGDCSQSPTAKRPRRESASENWYSPPVVPLNPGEYWVHEDCSVWSAGVFLVKGRLYGLEEAVRLAKETVCSKCHTVGATLGCLFKGCPNKYHYICAVKSGCVLDENNFSMKCTKHKNKTVRASFMSWRDNR